MFSITLKKIIDEFQLEEVSGCERLDKILVKSSDINRPGLQLAGFLEYFGNDRIQVVGKTETTYLSRLSHEERCMRLEEVFKYGIPCVIVAKGLDI
ncbi:MAG TPA: HPr kinase/phosphorylase, partial [Clostridia bacterium]